MVTIELLLVAIDVLINQWNARFYNALQDRNWDVFVREIGVFSLLAACFIALAVYQVYLNQWLQIRWRRWLTGHYLGEWLDHSANHYRMQLQGDAADNPDQRVSDDVKLFVEKTMDIGLNLLNSFVTLLSFVVILWGLSAAAPLHLFGSSFDIPGYLVWGALIYAIFGTALTQWIGSPLVRLNFQQQRYEADFRFNLVRVRENSEQIALMKGEQAERCRLWDRFNYVVENWYGIMSRTKRLTAFTASYGQAAVIFPYVLVAPAYFAGKIQLGGVAQTASAFGSVQRALSVFVNIYRSLADWRAVLSRLDGFEMSIQSAQALAAGKASIQSVTSKDDDEIGLAPAAGPPAERHAPGLRRRLQASCRRAHAGHRTIRLRQIDAVSRHRRHLAVWRRHDRDSAQCRGDDAAAAAVFSDRIAARRDRLSRRGQRVSAQTRSGTRWWRSACPSSPSGSTRKRTGTGCCRSASSSASGSHGRCCMRRNTCSWMRRPPRSTSRRRRHSTACCCKSCPATTIVSIGHRSTLEAFHDRKLTLVRDGDRFALSEAGASAKQDLPSAAHLQPALRP